MKNRFKILLTVCLLIIMVASISLLNGCLSLTPEEGYEALTVALNNTLANKNDKEHASNNHIFYWKESVSTPREGITNLVEITTANVLCEIDKDYHFVKNDTADDYDYADLRVNVTKKYDSKLVYELMCGYDTNGTTRLAERGSLDRTSQLTNDDNYTFNVGTVAKDFVKTDAFKPYTLEAKLAELKSLKPQDLVYDGVPNAGVQKKSNVTTITCKLSKDYLDNYKAVYGVPSILDGKYVVIEIAYERISAIMVYQNEPGASESNTSGILALEYESYKLEIVYTGPKFTVPHKQPNEK